MRDYLNDYLDYLTENRSRVSGELGATMGSNCVPIEGDTINNTRESNGPWFRETNKN